MNAEELIELLSERPFEPLIVRLDSGREYTIRHPELAVVTENVVAIAYHSDQSKKIPDRISTCSVQHITEVERASLPH